MRGCGRPGAARPMKRPLRLAAGWSVGSATTAAAWQSSTHWLVPGRRPRWAPRREPGPTRGHHVLGARLSAKAAAVLQAETEMATSTVAQVVGRHPFRTLRRLPWPDGGRRRRSGSGGHPRPRQRFTLPWQLRTASSSCRRHRPAAGDRSRRRLPRPERMDAIELPIADRPILPTGIGLRSPDRERADCGPVLRRSGPCRTRSRSGRHAATARNGLGDRTLFPNGRTGHDGASSCSAWPTAKWMSSKGEGESFSRRAGNLCHSLPGELVDEVAGVGQRSREALELGQDQGVAVSAGREGHA